VTGAAMDQGLRFKWSPRAIFQGCLIPRFEIPCQSPHKT
jgi:hypothetical protein